MHLHVEKYKPTNPILTPLESDPHFKYKMRKGNPQNSPQSTVRVENFEVFLISLFLWVADNTIIHVEGGINTRKIV